MKEKGRERVKERVKKRKGQREGVREKEMCKLAATKLFQFRLYLEYSDLLVVQAIWLLAQVYSFCRSLLGLLYEGLTQVN